MWSEPDPDPGGDGPPTSSREITDLKDENEQQQVLIAQLKEMLRKEQSTVSQEKLEEYINTLSKMNARKPRVKGGESSKTEKVSSRSGIDSIKSEKVNLLKKQLEENKAKLAERGIRQRGLEDMVSTLKAQLNDSQQNISSTPLTSTSIEKNLDYNKTSSQEELYNILLVKERRITDLLEKNHNYEASILDLQENLKEKDSVIDARTKAITLMTENLSKKGKDTLDALDDTKVQMRTMQENFVQLEAEMKARQLKLLDDLKLKNLEIVELQQNVHKLNEEKSEQKDSNNFVKDDNEGFEKIIKNLQDQLNQTNSLNENHLRTIAELSKNIQESQENIERLKSFGADVDIIENSGDSSEIVKLKKQLDESNKNMIKMKAQSKSKIKELTKKIDAFKKISDANALVLQLQNEITRLNEKNAELEDEKGNLQLKMMESTDSTRDSEEENKVIEENSRILVEKEKIISLLESEIISLREEINQLNEKVSNSEKVQVTSEMNSIQVEEEMDKIESENKKLQEVVEVLKNEKNLLEMKIEELVKEKLELNSKLDNYIQENMDLIDKLEKLSAEKVSSAESIEIVEGLTQQEKLELAAYQKHSEGSGKGIEDDIGYAPPEFNESVLQLNEDSTELLKKIEMFNVERKEVMMKMETLKEENNRLSLKIDEIENNRDVLAETYEQLQTEKEEMQSENETLARRLREIESKSVDIVQISSKDDAKLLSELRSLEIEYEKLKEENENFRKTLKDFDAKIHEKDNLESQLAETKSKIKELEANLDTNLEEIDNYRMIIEENKNELINSSNIINSLQNILKERENQIKDLNVLINDLNVVVGDLQESNKKLGNFDVMEKQIEELKTALNEQMEDAEAQAKEYQEEITRIQSLYEKKLQENHKEMERLTQEINERDSLKLMLENQIQEKEEKINNVIGDMKQKYLALQEQLDTNGSSLKDKVEELSTKNKEQLEKMKKIAANLKKKTQAYQELEDRYKGEKEKWETELNHKESSTSNLISQLEATKEELARKTARLEEMTDMVESLDQQRTDLQHTLLEMKHDRDKLSEVSLSHELSTSLHEEFDGPLPESATEDKIKELELIIETNESELTHYEKRSKKLEQDVSKLLEEKEMLERRHLELEEMLSTTSKNIEEKCLIEEELSRKLQEASASDKKLQEAVTESKDLLEKNREQEELIHKLKVKVKKSNERANQLKALQSNVEELETSNEKLRQDLVLAENARKHSQEEYEAFQRKYAMDFERIESDYQVQMEELLLNKNDLTVECEKLQEMLGTLREREETLLGEINEYKSALGNQNAHANQIEQLHENLNIATANFQSSCKEIENLKQRIEDLQKQIVVQIAESAVEDVILEAQRQVSFINTKETQTDNAAEEVTVVQVPYQENVQLFQWPSGREENPESFLQDNQKPVQTVLEPQDAEISKGNLIQQIKVLESTLGHLSSWNTEALNDCKGLLLNLANLVHEKLNSQKLAPSNYSALEAQIVSTSDITDAAKDVDALREVEFVKCNPCLGEQSEAVDEELIQPKKAYLCHLDQKESKAGTEVTKEELVSKIKALEFLLFNVDREKDKILGECSGMLSELSRLVYEKIMSQKPQTVAPQALQPTSDLEAQILSPQDIVDASNDPKTLQALEFTRCDLSLGPQSVQVVEDVQQPKKAYLTYQGSSEAFAENDDGWGWGPEEVKLEEEHLHKVDGSPQIQALRDDIGRLNEQLQVLQVDRENHLEEIKQLQVKSGKLIKKCKELKQKNDKLLEKSMGSSDFFDLDQTIIEELRTQIATLEKKVEETRSDLEKERTEKGNCFKKLESLTTANEKLLEAREIQTSEILRWKRKYEEIDEKMQQVGGSDGFAATSTTHAPKEPEETGSDSIEELQRIVKELSLDNEELQSLLNEQRQQRLDSEKQKHSGRSEEEFLKLKKDCEEEVKILQQELSNKSSEFGSALVQKEGLIAKLQADLNENIIVIQSLERDLKNLNDVNQQLEETLTKSREEEKSSHMERIYQHEALLHEKSLVSEQLKIDYDEAIKLNESLTSRLESMSTELEDAKQKYNETVSNLQSELRPQESGPESLNPVVQQLTSYQANSLRELVDLLQKVQADFTNLSVTQSELIATNSSLTERINELEEELQKQKQQYNDLQSLSSRNILDLQTDVEETKQKRDQLERESSKKVEELEMELAEEKRRYLESQFETQLLEAQKMSNESVEIFEQKVSQLEALLVEKDINITELREVSENLHRQRAIVDEELKQLKNALNEKEVELDNITAKMDEKLADTILDLEQKWQMVVDERGNTVAESWKYHLGAVENEFSRVQEQLKNEINELEEKCNALVNENNELRKNVDTEIKNEVDRISALQQQITDRQHAITELNKMMSVVESEKAELRNEKAELERILALKEAELSSSKVMIETTQTQFDEKRQVLEEIVKILEKNTSWPLSFEKEDMINELQRQVYANCERENEFTRLQAQMVEYQSLLEGLQIKDAEIKRLSELVENLQGDKAVTHEQDQEIRRLNHTVEHLTNQMSLLQQNEQEMVKLNDLIEQFKKQEIQYQQNIQALQQEREELKYAVEDYKKKLEEFKLTHIALQNSLEEKTQQISYLNQQLQLTEALTTDNNKEKERIDSELSNVKQEYHSLQQSMADCQQHLFGVTQDLGKKTHELEICRQQLVYAQQSSEVLEAELAKLREMLAAKEQESEMARQSQLVDLRNYYEELVSAKDIDLQTARAQLNESVTNNADLTDKVEREMAARQQVLADKQVLEGKVSEQSALLEEETKQLSEMRDIIQEQVVKIEELKNELLDKSKDYDSLVAEMDMNSKAVTQQPTSSMVGNASLQSARRSLVEDDMSEPVSRAELDLALYMLHQRDVRCEELMVELTQLLEERDTLQLKLSNALREKEDIRRGTAVVGSEEMPPSSALNPSTPQSKTSAVSLAASGTELGAEAVEIPSGEQNLASKLSELRTVGYKKDKTFLDEQEVRRMQQMSIMQQHISDASRLPAEAAARLVDANYTLSRDVQSPSKVLLNWLWGRSTPKLDS